MTTPDPTVLAAREALWRWWAFAEFENINLDAISDQQYEDIEQGIEAALTALCDASEHTYVYDGCGIPEHQFCVYCKNLIPDEVLAAQREEANRG